MFHEAQGLLWPAHPFIVKAAAAPSPDYMGKLMQMHAKRFLPHGRVIVGGWQLSAGCVAHCATLAPPRFTSALARGAPRGRLLAPSSGAQSASAYDYVRVRMKEKERERER